MEKYRYILEPYKGSNSRHECPSCGKRKSFALYVDIETNEHIHSSCGRCNREDQCGYHLTPKQYFEQDPTSTHARAKSEFLQSIKIDKVEALPEIIIDPTIMKKSLTGYENNHFVSYLISLFGDKITKELIAKYFIGTSKLWDGATIFWQIDTKEKIKAGKVMLYNPETGKRIKQPFNHIQWIHKLTKQEGELKQCFFGEHLLRNNNKPIAIVESEKTAVIASAYFPDFIWLACGGLSMLNYEKCLALKDRQVILYPDLNGFDKWKEKADLFLPKIVTSYSISTLLEKVATEEERKGGLDLADYLIRYEVAKFHVNMHQISNDNIQSDIDSYDTPETLKTLLRELSIKVPHDLPINIDGMNSNCLRGFIKESLEGYEKVPNNKTIQKKIRGIYKTMHLAGDTNFKNKY